MIPTLQLGQFGRSIGGASGGDPFFSNVVLLLHFDGTNGQTSTVDSSPLAHGVTGSFRTLSTTQAKFGATSSTSLASGAGRWSVADDPSWHFAADEFTVEAQCYFTTNPVSGNNEVIIGHFGGSGNYSWRLYLNSGQLRFIYSTNGTSLTTVGAAFAPTLNQWYHIAVDRDASDNLRLYVNGSVLTTSALGSASFYNSSASLLVAGDPGWWGFAGFIDEVRITKGVARYAGSFTPPTAAFPNF